MSEPENSELLKAQLAAQAQRIEVLEDRLRQVVGRLVELETQRIVSTPQAAPPPAQEPPKRKWASLPQALAPQPQATPPVHQPVAQPVQPPVAIDLQAPVYPLPASVPVYTPVTQKVDSPFLSEAEMNAPAPRILQEQVVEPAEPEEPWEVRLTTKWLPRIGGVSLLVALAVGGTLVAQNMGPGARVALGYLAAIVVAVGGFFVMKKSQVVGQVTLAIAAAMAYFVSFGSHFLPLMRAFDSAVPSIALMMVFVGVLVLMAEKWKSQAVAAMGFGLGVVGALVSSGTSQEFALLAIGVLAVGAGIVLVRHEWRHLTALALAGTYLSTAALWVILWAFRKTTPTHGEVFAHLGAVFAYHIIFTAAFWRWGRPWMAREMAAAQVQDQEVVPSFDFGTLPYASGFAILNSIGLLSLVLCLWVFTNGHVPELWTNWLHRVLFLVAAMEGARLLVPALRRGVLGSFHALTAFSFVSAALIVKFSGPTESAILAAEALVIAVAASRAAPLKLLRPLTVFCAFWSASQFRASGVVTTSDLMMHLAPGVFLLMSALPWEFIWVARPAPFARGFLGAVELLSGQLRGVTALGLIIAALEAYFPNNGLAPYALAALAIVLVLGIRVLRARAWWAAGLCATLLALMLMPITNSDFPVDADSGRLAIYVLSILAFAYVWQEAARPATAMFERMMHVLAFVCMALAMMGAAWTILHHFEPLEGLWQSALAGALGLVAFAGYRMKPLPALVRGPVVEEDAAPLVDPMKDPAKFLVMPWAMVRMGAVAALAVGVMGAFHVVFVDSTKALASALIVSAALTGAWFIKSVDASSNRVWQGFFAAALLAVMGLSLLVYGKMSPWSVLQVTALILATTALFTWRRSDTSIAVGCFYFAMVPVLAFAALYNPNPAWRPALAPGLLVALLCIGITRAFPYLKTRLHITDSQPGFETKSAIILGTNLGRWLVVAGAVVAMAYLAQERLVPGRFGTASWFLLGAVLLGMGFLFIDKTMRYTSLAIFAAAMGRIFLHDLRGASKLTWLVAFFVAGMVLVGAGIAYGFMRTRVQRGTSTNPPPGPGSQI